MRYPVKALLWAIILCMVIILAVVAESVYTTHWQAVKQPVDTCEYIASIGDIRVYADHMGGAFWRRVKYD